MSESSPKDLSPIVGHVAPYVAYVGIGTIASSEWLGLDAKTGYVLKGIAATILLWCYRTQFPKISTRGWGLGVQAGLLGVGLWIGLERLQTLLPAIQQLTGWLIGGSRAGFNPTEGASFLDRLFLIVRLAELVVVVPLAEELFWRSFLARYLIAEDFRNVPEGRFTTSSFVLVTLGFATVHPELLAAIGWGALANLVYMKTKNIWACICMHAVTNGGLAIYIMATGSWYLW